MGQWLTFLGVLLTGAYGIWQWFQGFKDESKKRALAAQKVVEEGFKSGDTSEITAGLDRLHRPD